MQEKESNKSVADSGKLGNSKVMASSGTYSDIMEDDESESGGAGSYDRLAMCFLCRK